jgi:hypothetical protein
MLFVAERAAPRITFGPRIDGAAEKNGNQLAVE